MGLTNLPDLGGSESDACRGAICSFDQQGHPDQFVGSRFHRRQVQALNNNNTCTAQFVMHFGCGRAERLYREIIPANDIDTVFDEPIA